ncbi:SPOR domain-containing protein [Pseudomonadota bacterium]
MSSLAFADYQDGLDAYTYGNYGKAMAEWQAVVASPPSEVNPAIYAEAHFAIAKLYWLGAGVEQDYRRAYDWLLKAAELDHAAAQAKLGFMYTDGLAVRQNFDEAFAWYSKAAKGGNVDGLYNLGIFYYYGWGVERDTTMAAQYLAAASALGDGPAEEALQQVLAEIGQGGSEVAGESAAESAGGPSVGPSVGAASAAIEPEPAPEKEIADVGAALAAIDSADASTATPIIAAEAAPTVSTPTIAAVEPLLRGEDWIRDQDSERYTIQVMALKDRALLEDIVAGYEDLAPFAIYTVQKTTNPLYVLVQGSYPDVASARAVQNRFPRKIQKKDKLWIRRFERVQALLE